MYITSLGRCLISVLLALGAMLSPAVTFAQGDVTIGGPFEGESSTLNGAGGTFPAPLYQKMVQRVFKSHARECELPGNWLGRWDQGHPGPDR